MSQLRLAYVNCKIVSTDSSKNAIRTKGSSAAQRSLLMHSLPSFAWKAVRLQKLKPHAAAILEKLVDDLLGELEGQTTVMDD